MAEIAGGHPFKVTFPAVSLFGHPFSYKPGVTTGYEDLQAFVAHAIEIEQRLVTDAIAAGARYVQFDFPIYVCVSDPVWTARFEAEGHNVRGLLDAALAADKSVLEDIPSDVTTALHICRGNYRSSWMCEDDDPGLPDRST